MIPVLKLTPVGVGDAGDVGIGQFAVGTVHHATELAGVDEQDFATPTAGLPVLTITGQKPQCS